MSNKPPLGLMPRHIWLEHRRRELIAAMRLYKIAGKAVPGIWINEFLNLIAEGVRFPVNGVEPFLVNEKEGVDNPKRSNQEVIEFVQKCLDEMPGVDAIMVAVDRPMDVSWQLIFLDINKVTHGTVRAIGLHDHEDISVLADRVKESVAEMLKCRKELADKRRIPDPGEGWRLIDQATDTPQQGDEVWRHISKEWAGRMYSCDTDYSKDSHYRRRVEPKAGRWVRCKNGYQFVDGPPNYYPWYEELPEIGEWMAGPGRGNNYRLPVGTEIEIDARGSNVTAKVVAMVAHQMRSAADALRAKTTSNAVWQKNGGNENFVHEFADEPYRVTKYPDPPSDEQGCAT